MEREQSAAVDTATSIVSAVDRGEDGAEFVIADVSADDTWIAVPYEEALPVSEWE